MLETRVFTGEKNGRHKETRTPDLYRVKKEVNNLKPFAYLAFPNFLCHENLSKQPSFGDELVTSFSNALQCFSRPVPWSYFAARIRYSSQSLSGSSMGHARLSCRRRARKEEYSPNFC